MPKRSKSYREAAECIISTAQHARPNVMGQSDPLRAQFTKSSTLETTYSVITTNDDASQSLAVSTKYVNGNQLTDVIVCLSEQVADTVFLYQFLRHIQVE
jgi:hypothetical protein